MRRIAFFILVVLTFAPTFIRAQSLSPIYPAALRPGDTIAVVAPAGSLEPYRIELARKRLIRMGFRVRLPRDLYRKRGYLAGSDEARAQELMAAFRDPAVKAIFPGTGGFGVTRMLDQLDYDVIRANPKILLGFSDITGLHLAIGRKTGLITFHSPVLMYGLGSREDLSDFSAEYLWRAVLYSSYFDWAGDPLEPGYSYYIPSEVATLRTLAPGKAQGRLTGGNLSLICALMGTPYEIETDGRVLFLEDVNEEPYRIDRFLSQLRLAGKFDRVAGVILGTFTGCETKKGSDSLSLAQVFNDYFANLPVPVVVGFPAGHARHNATLPMNALVELDASTRRIRILENPVRIEETASIAPNQPEPDAEPPAPDPEPAGPSLPENQFEPVEAPPASPISPEILRRIP
ncbi:MAG TPA: LD-carboxypeptidase [Phycisphaerae bacterium]|nr:LD-carboxypeptidase [Phycisphaerae bacterium]HOL25135.1 LD-carboxypeptidase [Phycisphaerae bacterium]HPP19689.1 LD-carboxypeptidase [Phycisphaerae bacterium]HQA45583.1 LD-carboxypeptidase [Phycisphaerae bacterium]